METSVDEIWNIFVHILQNLASVWVPKLTVTLNKKRHTLIYTPIYLVIYLRCKMRAARISTKSYKYSDWHCLFKAWRNNFRREI